MAFCRVYVCWRQAALGSEFCMVDHGWWEKNAPPRVVRRLDPAAEAQREVAPSHHVYEEKAA